MTIGEGQIEGGLFNFLCSEKVPFCCILWTLPSVSKITPDYLKFHTLGYK